jgi:hypothetical protein
MSKKIQPRPPVAISESQGSVKYILEDVFWVPISNSRWKRSTSLDLSELHSEKLCTGKVSESCDTESS